MRQSQRGFATVWALLLFSFVTLLATSLYLLHRQATEAAGVGLATTQLRLAAESGVVRAVARLRGDDGFRGSVMLAGKEVKVGADSDGAITTETYARADGDGFTVLAVAARGERRVRAVARLNGTSGGYQIERWEH